MDKMKLNNHDITVVPRFIDESMLPTIDSIKNDETHTVTTTNNKPKVEEKKETKIKQKNDEKWYIKYKWYIVGIIVVLIVLVLGYMYFSNNSSQDVNELHHIDDTKDIKKIKANIIYDNESVASDLFYPKKLETINEDDEDFDNMNGSNNMNESNKINIGTSDNDDKSTKQWIEETRSELIKSINIDENKSESSDKYKILDDASSSNSSNEKLKNKLEKIFNDDEKSIEEFNSSDIPIMQDSDNEKDSSSKPLSSIDDLFSS